MQHELTSKTLLFKLGIGFEELGKNICERDKNNNAEKKKKDFLDSPEKKLHAHLTQGNTCHTQYAKRPTTHTLSPVPLSLFRGNADKARASLMAEDEAFRHF